MILKLSAIQFINWYSWLSARSFCRRSRGPTTLFLKFTRVYKSLTREVLWCASASGMTREISLGTVQEDRMRLLWSYFSRRHSNSKGFSNICCNSARYAFVNLPLPLFALSTNTPRDLRVLESAFMNSRKPNVNVKPHIFLNRQDQDGKNQRVNS